MPYKDPEKRRIWAKAYREANREIVRKYQRDWVEANKDRVRNRQRIWYLANKQLVVNRVKDWAEANPENIKEISKKHRKKYPDRINTRTSLRRAGKKKVNDIHTPDDRWMLAEFYSLAKLREEVFGFKWHVDHIVPLSKGGRHCLSNLQVVPEYWNLSKGNRNTDLFVGATIGDDDND